MRIRSLVSRGGLKAGEVYELSAKQCRALIAEGVVVDAEVAPKPVKPGPVEPVTATATLEPSQPSPFRFRSGPEESAD